MSNEFKLNDRVSIDKNLTYTTPRFGAVSDMRSILTGTVTRNPFQNEDEVIVTLDYPDDFPESKRVGYSYDSRDLTLISREFKPNDKVSIDKNLTYTKPRFSVCSTMKKYLTGTVASVHGKGNDRVYVLVKSNDTNEVVGKYLYDPRDLTLISTEPTEFKQNDRVEIDKSLKYTRDRFATTRNMKNIFTGTVRFVNKENNIAKVKLDGVDYNFSYDLRDLTPITNGFPTPTNVKTSNDTTTVEFSDNTTTSVTKSAGDPYDLETAIAYCIAKKITTNSHIKHLAETAEEVVDKVTTEFYNKFLKPYGFLNETAYTDVEIETLKNYLKTLNDVRSEMALIAIENNLTKDELFNKLRG